MRVLARCHGAFEDVPDSAVLTVHVLVLRGVMTVRQTAHAGALGSVTIYATGQKSQRSGEHRDDHENGLSTAHRGRAIIAQQSCGAQGSIFAMVEEARSNRLSS